MFLEMNKEINTRSVGGSGGANILWKMSEATGRGDACYVQTSEQNIVNR